MAGAKAYSPCPRTRRRSIKEIRNGATSTILAGEAAGNFKPRGHSANGRDPALGINVSPSGFGAPWHPGGAQFVFADGHTQFLSAKTDVRVLKALATPAGGERVQARDY